MATLEEMDSGHLKGPGGKEVKTIEKHSLGLKLLAT